MQRSRFFMAFIPLLVVLGLGVFSLVSENKVQNPADFNIYECLVVDQSEENIIKHLNEQSEKINYTVLLESREKLSTSHPSLTIENLRDQVENFDDKVIFVSSVKLPELPTRIAQEFYFKNLFLEALSNCNNHDIIIFSSIGNTLTDQEIKKITKQIKANEQSIHSFSKVRKNFKNIRNIYISTYDTVKTQLPANIDDKNALNSSIWDWKSFFFPFEWGEL